MSTAAEPLPETKSRLSPRARFAWTAAVACIVALGAALRFYHLGARSFWFDEVQSVAYARLPLVQLARILWIREINMALYYVLLHGWVHLGVGEAVVRALSALAGVATLPLVYLVGRRIYDSFTGTVAAMLLGLSAFHIRYSQEARAYALLAFLLTLATLLLLEAVRRGTRRAWTWYAFCAAAAVYAQVLGVLVVAAHLVWLMIRRKDLGHVARAFLLLAILLAPLALCVVHAGAGPVSWVPPLTAQAMVRSFVLLAGDGMTAAVLAAVLWIAGLVAMARRRAPQEAAVVWLWLLFPIAAIAAVSVLQPLFVDRFLLMCAPAAALASAAGIRSLGRRPAMAVAGVGLIALTAVNKPRAYSDPMDSVAQDYRGAMQYILRSARPGDAIMFYPVSGSAAYEIYSGAGRGPVMLYPSHPPAEKYLNYFPQPLAELLRPDLTAKFPRVFLVVTGSPAWKTSGDHFLGDWLEKNYPTQTTTRFSWIEVRLYSTR